MKIFLYAAAITACLLTGIAEAGEPSLENQCIELKYNILLAIDIMEGIEEDGGTVHPNDTAEVLTGAMLYVTHCREITGELFEEEEY